MVGRLLSSFVGARVVLGLAVAGLLASGFLYWRLSAAREEAAQLQEAAAKARQVAEANAKEAQAARERAEQLDDTLSELRRNQRKRRERLRSDLGELRNELQGSDCSSRAVPDGARQRLFQPANGDQGKDQASGGAD